MNMLPSHLAKNTHSKMKNYLEVILMEKNHGKKIFSQEDIMKLLDTCYRKAISGIGQAIPPVEKMAQDYLEKSATPSDAAKKMINMQVAKCTTSGVVTGFGGLIVLPVSIPANIGSVLYVQMRMIACTAYMAGYDLNSDQVQTIVFACLAGVTVNQIIKKTGAKFGEKVANNLIQKIPGSVLTKINQKVGFRFITRFGEKGLINLGKMIPVVGAAINGGFDFAETKVIGNRAYKWFFNGDFSVAEKEPEEVFEVVDADFEDVSSESADNDFVDPNNK